VVYPGLVDAHGGVKLGLPEAERGEGHRPWAAERAVQGFTPHRKAAAHVSATAQEIAALAAQGVVASAAHPGGGLAPGHSVVLMHRGGAAGWRVIVADEPGVVLAFEGARGAYPGTLFGVVAHLRQAFADAARQEAIRVAYARDPRGLPVPAYDPDLAVLRRLAAGDLPVFFLADGAEDIRRALGLARELGFRPMIVGGQEAWREAAALRAAGVPVLVSVDFPEPREWKPDAPAEEPLGAAAAREKQRLEDLYANAGRLAAAGVPIALTSGGGKAELLAGARKAVAHGLAPAAALAALTGTPARLLGIPAVARVEPGMAATFLVANGDLLAEGTTVVHTFVEGHAFAGRSGARSGGGAAASAAGATAADVAGTWSLRLAAQGTEFDLRMTLEQEGGTFHGTLTGGIGAGAIRDGRIDGDALSFTLVIQAGGQAIEGQATGTLEPDGRITGTGSTPMGGFRFTATRSGGAAAEGGAR
jgi:imidazolonepropionase-like amidohydrolase